MGTRPLGHEARLLAWSVYTSHAAGEGDACGDGDAHGVVDADRVHIVALNRTMPVAVATLRTVCRSRCCGIRRRTRPR